MLIEGSHIDGMAITYNAISLSFRTNEVKFKLQLNNKKLSLNRVGSKYQL